jgi:hypothetical protein
VSYALFLLRSDLFWAMLAGIGLGAVVAAATILPARRSQPERVRARKWTATYLALALLVVAGAGAYLFVGAADIAYRECLIVGLVATALTAAAGRFPRAAGIPIVVAVVVAAAVVGFGLRDWIPVRADTEVARIRALSVVADESVVEISGPLGSAGVPEVVTLPGTTVVASVDTLVISRFLFLTGSSLRFRHDDRGLLSIPADREKPVADAGTGLLARLGAITPDVSVSSAFPLRLLRPYSVVVRVDGTVIVSEQRGQE